jgi:hypothetical protein
MVKFNEIPREVAKFTQEQLRERERRLASPAIKASIERTQTLLKDDIKSSCVNGVEALYRFAIAAPCSSLWEGTKEFGNVLSHNMSTKNHKKKKNYSEVPAAMVTEFLTQWGKGAISTAKLAGNLSVALGRATVLAGRYTIGR